ncbi:MAG: 1-acyl-sn-glycerol-3-phosphate acyltransferase [Clostridia bacterium]|nr:1-acyl-sn-glycerol-3-phosphate acyltransferase [Clostridia bacterium]
MIGLFNWFVKITGWPVQFLCFRTKILYEDRKVQGRHIEKDAIVISNHTSIFDYAVYLFVFCTRTLRFQMAEVLYEKPLLALLLRCLGGIRVDRNAHDFGFMPKSLSILSRGGVVGIFPESRLPRPGEARPLPFKVSAAYLALTSGSKIIPVVTNGSYFCRKRARVLIGKPILASDLLEEGVGETENLAIVSERLRERIIALEKLLYGTETTESR